jgi:hypothetical protein
MHTHTQAVMFVRTSKRLYIHRVRAGEGEEDEKKKGDEGRGREVKESVNEKV